LFKAEAVLQNNRELPYSASRILKKTFFGAGVKAQTDFMSQLNAIVMAYFANLTMIVLVVAAAAWAFGYFDPFHAPFAQSSFTVMITLSNIVTLASTYIASFQWTLYKDAVQFRQPKGPGRPVFYILFLLLSAVSIFFLAGTYLAFSFAVVLASIVTNSALLQLLVTERALKHRHSP
jgi:hypothetical protein